MGGTTSITLPLTTHCYMADWIATRPQRPVRESGCFEPIALPAQAADTFYI
jgi:hypothetical protein